MKVSDLLWHLTALGVPDDAEIDLMIEVLEPKPCQYQYPMQGLAYSKKQKKIILLHEKFNGEDK